MQNGELFISSHDGTYCIRVLGRATMECAPALRNLAKTLDTESFHDIKFNLRECTWMDSTFMGILAMIGLRAKKIGANAFMVNASKQNIDLLCGLGLKKLFQFIQEDADKADFHSSEQTLNDVSETEKNKIHAQTVLDAHETLMDVDTSNIKKFSNVVSMVRQDMKEQKE